MRSPNSEIYIKKENKTCDSDQNLFNNSQDNIHEKKKHKIQNDSTGIASEPCFSQSLLKVQKKKYSEMSGQLHSANNGELPVKKRKKVSGEVSGDFYIQDILNKYYSSDESTNTTPKKSKKTKIKVLNGISDNNDISMSVQEIKPEIEWNSTINSSAAEHSKRQLKQKNLKRLNQSNISNQNTDILNFGTQDIFKEVSSEEFVNSTPKKYKKKNNKELTGITRDQEHSPSQNGTILNANGMSSLNDSAMSALREVEWDSTMNSLSEPPKKRLKKKKMKRQSSISSQNETLNLSTHDILKQPSSEEFVNITPKKHKKEKNRKLNGITRYQEHNSSHNSMDLNANRTSSLNDSLPYTSDGSEVYNLHQSFDISTDNSTILSVVEETEVNLSCNKHKNMTKYNDITTVEKSPLNGDHSQNDDFYCQFCQSSFNNTSGCKVVNNGNHKRSGDTTNEFETVHKKKKKCKKLASKINDSGEKNSILNLLDNYLDRNDFSWDGDSKGTSLSHHSSSLSHNSRHKSLDLDGDGDKTNDINSLESVDKSMITVKKKKINKESLEERSKPKGQHKISQGLLSSKVLDSNNYNQDILDAHGVGDLRNDGNGSKTDESIDTVKKKKKKRKKSLNASLKVEFPDSHSSLATPLSRVLNSDNYGQDVLDADGSASEGGDAEDKLIEGIDKVEELRCRLKYLAIVVDFTVPELHQICNRSTKPTPQQKWTVAENMLPMKSGKFVKAEDEKIINNWKKFIKMYNFDDIPEAFYSLDKKHITVKEKQNFLFFLAQDLNDRTPYSVFQRFKLLTLQLKRGRFTEDENQYIINQIEETGCCRNYMADIALHLQRPFESIEKRIIRLRDQHTRKIKWNRTNLKPFMKYLLKVTDTDPDEVNKLKDRHISSEEWKRLSKKLDNLPMRILSRAWLEKIHPMLFIPDIRCDLREVKLKLVKMFYENNEYDWRAVDWKHYSSYFEGLTPLRIYSLMKTLVLSKVSASKRGNLKKCIKRLKRCTMQDLHFHYIHKIEYKNGEIVYLAQETSKTKKKDEMT